MSDNSHNDEIWRKILIRDLTDAIDVRVTRVDALAALT